MKRGTVPVLLYSDVVKPKRRHGWFVNRWFAVTRVDDVWQVVHRKTGLFTRYSRPHRKADIVALAQAAISSRSRQR